MDLSPAIWIALASGGLGALFTSLRILWEYERGVIFRLGKLTRAKGPGLIFLVPFGIALSPRWLCCQRNERYDRKLWIG